MPRHRTSADGHRRRVRVAAYAVDGDAAAVRATACYRLLYWLTSQ
jgi:hypothetical protein